MESIRYRAIIERVREANMQPLQLSVSCLRLGVRIDAAASLLLSAPPPIPPPPFSLSEGDILKHTLSSRSLTYSIITAHRCISVAGSRWVVDFVFR